MKTTIVIACIFVFMSSVCVFAGDAPRVYNNEDLQNYGSSSGDSSDRYYQDRKEERDQDYYDRKQTREEDNSERERAAAQRRLDMQERDKRREECRREADFNKFACPDKDFQCRGQWTNAYRDCNFIE